MDYYIYEFHCNSSAKYICYFPSYVAISDASRKLWHSSGCRILYQEIDYINEGKNADRFRRDFRNIKWVRVPVCHSLHRY